MGIGWDQISAFKVENLAKGVPLVVNGGITSVSPRFRTWTKLKLGYLFLVESFVDIFI